MSVQLISWAYAQTVGSPTEKSVLLALANRANHDTGRCDPSIERIVVETELSKRTVIRAIDSLINKGYIAKDKRWRNDGSRKTNAYTFPLFMDTVTQQGDTVALYPGVAVALKPEVDLEPEGPLAAEGAKAPTPRKRDPLWDTLTDIFGDATTETRRSLRGKVCRSLRKAGATPDEIVKRSRAWPRHFEGATFTELALEKHWDTLGRPPLRQRR